MNVANPCRCAKKLRGVVQEGDIDPASLLFARERLRPVREVAPGRCDDIDGYRDLGAEIYRAHPFYEPKDLAAPIRSVLDEASFRRTFEI